MSEKKAILKSASKMSVATFLSRILGFIRDMILAGFFGATGMSDTFFVAFRIPNLFREILAEGSMSSAFIPVLTEYKTKKGDEAVKRLVRITFTFIIIFVGLLCLLGILFSPYIVQIIAPGFVASIEKFDTTVTLTRIMFPFLLFVSLSALTMGALNTKGVFFVPALASAWFNVTIITVILLFYNYYKNPLILAALGVTVGGLFQFLTQLPSFFKNNYSLKPNYHFNHPGVKKMGVLILPSIFGMSVVQINIFISTALASLLPAGSITYLYYSMRLIHFPIGVFGVAMGIAVLPTLSAHTARDDIDKFKEDFSFSLRLLFFIGIPSMIGLIVLREPIVNLLFQRGEFNYKATQGTSFALLFYSLGIWSIVGVRVLTSTFYSMQDTKTPVKIAVAALITNIFFSIMLMGPLEHGGLALANTIASTVNFFLLFYLLTRRIGGIDMRGIISSVVKTLTASLVMGIVGWFLIYFREWSSGGETLIKSAHLFSVIAVCLIVYSLTAALLKNREIIFIFNSIKSAIKSGK